MTTIEAHPVQPPSPSPPARRRRSGPATWLGATVAVTGTVLALAGGGLFTLLGGDDTLSTGAHALDSRTAAIVSESADTHLGDAFAPRLGVQADARDDRALFTGVARADDVEAYLAGVAHTEVTDFDVKPFRVTRHDEPGTRVATPPADQDFWLDSDAGPGRARLDWAMRDGEYRFVVMNADGSPGVRSSTRVSVTLPHVAAVAAAIGGSGLVLLLGGVLLVAGDRRRSGRTA